MKTLVTGVFALDEYRRAALEDLGLELTFHKDERVAVDCPEQFEAVICNGLFSFQDIADFSNLKYIQLTSAGFDRVPMDYVRERGIRICNARGVYSIPMAEFALAGVLQLYKHMDFFRENQKKHGWEKHRNLLELAGRQVCILGCGSVGAECAKRFSAFGCQVTGVDVSAEPRAYFDEIVLTEDLERAVPLADILVLTIPLTEQTRHMINRDLLKKMKPGALLVNIARGAIVDTQALIEALHTGRLGGAVLDVFEEEPLSWDSPLWDMDNVIITPHNSFVGEKNQVRLTNVVINNIKSWRI
ncbi:MAG: hydroxyacid dehydrogenase [Oscillospiraceae bacterium]|nr:hydroxyacid dehydrogenase [Oscillospiraceae bacterium]